MEGHAAALEFIKACGYDPVDVVSFSMDAGDAPEFEVIDYDSTDKDRVFKTVKGVNVND